jgi:hypothetical protein
MQTRKLDGDCGGTGATFHARAVAYTAGFLHPNPLKMIDLSPHKDDTRFMRAGVMPYMFALRSRVNKPVTELVYHPLYFTVTFTVSTW